VNMQRTWMRRLMAVVAGAGLVAVMGLAAPQNVKKREKRQKDRIEKGVQEGSLTKKEGAKLAVQEKVLHEKIQQDRADGKGLTKAERAKIKKRQDNLSEKIYEQKRDAQTQKK